MPGTTFLVVEVPGLQQPFVEYSVNHAQATIDGVMQPVGEGRHGGLMQACLLLRNAPPGTIDGLLDVAGKRYGKIVTLRRDDALGTWLGTFQISPSSLTDPHAQAVLQFLQRHRVGLRWVRLEQGVCYLRCEANTPAQATSLAGRCRGYLEGMDVDAAVAVEFASVDDLGVWHELAMLAIENAPPEPLP